MTFFPNAAVSCWHNLTHPSLDFPLNRKKSVNANESHIAKYTSDCPHDSTRMARSRRRRDPGAVPPQSTSQPASVAQTAAAPVAPLVTTTTITTTTQAEVTATTAQNDQNGSIVMIGRHAVRRNRGIRGPQSALTDFLASHNISANQIRLDADRRRQQALASRDQNGDDAGEGPSNANVATATATSDGDEGEDDSKTKTTKRKRAQQKAIDKIKASKKFQKRKKHLPDSDDEEGLIQELLKNSGPQPGQMANC